MKLRDSVEILNYVNEVGFSLCVGVKDVPLNNLWDITQDPDWLKTIGPWLDELILEKKIVYPLMIKRKACVVSREFLPYFYRLQSAVINLIEYEPDELVKDGKLSLNAARIIKSLQTGAKGVSELRKITGLDSKEGKSAFDKAMMELKEPLAIVKVDTRGDGWGENVFNLTVNAFPDEVHVAKKLTPIECYEKIVSRYFRCHSPIAQSDLQRLLPWDKAALSESLHTLQSVGKIKIETKRNDKNKTINMIEGVKK